MPAARGLVFHNMRQGAILERSALTGSTCCNQSPGCRRPTSRAADRNPAGGNGAEIAHRSRTIEEWRGAETVLAVAETQGCDPDNFQIAPVLCGVSTMEEGARPRCVPAKRGHRPGRGTWP
jgi:hypothetical protein